MKKRLHTLFGLILAIALVGTTLLQAGSPRMVLLEHMTNASCPPCATYNPAYQDFLMDNLNSNMIPITYRASWPGADVMNAQNPSMHNSRVSTYYGTSGVPNIRVQGTYNTNPASLGNIESEAAKYIGETSPITLDITETRAGNNMSINVTVSSDDDLSNKALRVCVVEFHHFYENAGNNGEKDFYFTTREMLPNSTGQSISIAAGESEDFEFSYEINASMYNAEGMYVVAFIQNDANKEVLQAASTFKAAKPNIMTDVQYDYIESNKILSKEIVISNPTEETIEFDLSISEANTTSYIAGWSAEVTPASLSIAPGQTKSALVNIRSSTTAGYFWTEVVATGKSENYVNIPGSLFLYVLSEDAKNVFYGWSNNNFPILYNDYIKLGPFQNTSALMPLASIEHYDPTQFDLAIFTVDYWNRGSIGVNSAVAGTINSLIDAEKDILITGELELALAEGTSGVQQAMQLFRGNIGVSLGGTAQRIEITNGQISGVIQFNCKGIVNDPISDGMNVQLNQYSQSYPYYVLFTDYMGLMSGSDAEPFLYFDDDESKIGGVRWEKGATRLVYMTFGFEALANSSQRAGFINKTITWLTKDAVAGPELAASKTAINFGKVDINEYEEMTFDIENTGTTTTDLVIDELIITSDGNDAEAFDFGDFSNIAPIPAGEKYTVTVKFTPSEDKEYNATLTVKANNSVDYKEVTVDLIGKGGISSVAELPNGMFTISAAPNPFDVVSRIDYTITTASSEAVNIFVINSTGKVVKTLVNSTVAPGTYNVDFQAAGLASGTYYVIGQLNGQSVRIPLVLTK